MKSKKDYIANRYIRVSAISRVRYINGYHILKDKKIAMPFTAFYPDPENIYKNTID